MSAKEYSLASLIPEPLTFRDRDTQIAYRARTPDMFGVIDSVDFEWMDQEFRASLQSLQELSPKNHVLSAERSAEQIAEMRRAAAVRVEDVVDRMVQLLIPELPHDRLQALTFTDKAGFLDWWRKQTIPAPTNDAGKAKAGKPIRGPRLPASAAHTD